MKKIVFLILFFYGFQIFSPVLAKPAPQQDQAKQVIVDFFQAMADLNFSKLRSYCQPGFELLEHGEVWSIDVLENKLKPNVGTGMHRENKFEFIQVKVQGKTAWVSYWNQAHITRTNQPDRHVKWLESAVLVKTSQGWKISLLHSTVVPQKK